MRFLVHVLRGSRPPGCLAAFALIAALSLACGTASAQHEHVPVLATGNGSGQLVVDYDLSKRIVVFETFCLPAAGQCLYTTINPAFLSPDATEAIPDGTFRISDGTRVNIEIVDIAPELALNVNGNRLNAPGRSASLGVVPFHTHPSWQLLVAPGVTGEFHIAYRLTSPSPQYASSDVIEQIVSNIAPTPSESTPTPTPTPSCAGDCNDDGEVTIDEVIIGVGEALGQTNDCRRFDGNQDGEVTIDELIAAINMALNGCRTEPTPQPVSFAELQASVFTSCLGSGCHNSRERLSGLVLEGAEAYASLVNATPGNFAAAANGLLRVTPGDLDHSFLWIKLGNPPPQYGSRMPLEADPLNAEQLRKVRDWILLGAQP